MPAGKNPTDALDEVGLFDFETKIRKMMFDMIDPWMKRQISDQQTVAKIRADLEKANRKAEDQDFALQKIDAKLATFDDIYKNLAAFVSSTRL